MGVSSNPWQGAVTPPLNKGVIYLIAFGIGVSAELPIPWVNIYGWGI